LLATPGSASFRSASTIVGCRLEGALIMGLGGALFESIDFADGQILNPRFQRLEQVIQDVVNERGTRAGSLRFGEGAKEFERRREGRCPLRVCREMAATPTVAKPCSNVSPDYS
jgi:hypothetical protein